MNRSVTGIDSRKSSKPSCSLAGLAPERQLGLLWGAVALATLALTPAASRLGSALPACPVKTLLDLPCPTCGTTRAAQALAHADLAGALAANPLATVGWLAFLAGGAAAGAKALFGPGVREPSWIESPTLRWLLITALTVNWIYLVAAGI